MALLTPIGTTLKLAATGVTPVEVGDVTQISGPSPSVEGLDTTSLTQTTVTRIAGRTDWGSVSFTVNMSEVSDSTLNFSELDALGGTAVDWSINIVCADCSGSHLVISGSGILSQVNPTVAGGSVVTASMDVQISGDVTVDGS